jgi:cytochrome P450
VAIRPEPPRADVALPWEAPVADVVATMVEARARCGDTFAVASGGVDHLFLFSPEGVRSFYALPEAEASKGVADWQMLLRKLPPELFDGRRTLPHELFGREDAGAHLAALDGAIDEELDVLGDAGEVDVFALTRRLGHRMGLAAWGGTASARGERFTGLVEALDELDGSDAFVHPGDMAAVAADDHGRERAAMARAEALLSETLAERRDQPVDDLLGRIIERWDGDDQGIARDVILVHLGSMSNLFAALGWTIVDLLLHPDVQARVRAGEEGLLERCALESTRLAQRSIMLRAVLRPTTVTDEATTWSVEPGDVVATFLPLTNTSAMPGLEGYDPDRWLRRRLRDEDQLAARELVTTFGHGRHTCPAMPFSLSAMTRSVQRLLDAHDLEAGFDGARPLPGQIGGVARADGPCPMHYSARR